MPIQTSLTKQLGIAHPLIQAPMAGGATTPDLVSAVCEAGALGSIAAPYLSAEQIGEVTHAVRSRTTKPFGINLFAPLPMPTATDPESALRRVAGYHRELGLPAPQMPAAVAHPFDDQLAAALESGAAVFSFTFGPLPTSAIDAVKARGMLLFGTATTVDEAIALERLGVDAIVAQGSEAGAHRGTFGTNADFDGAMIGTIALVPQVVDAVTIPVIASGAIMDGRGMAAALVLGAQGVQMGTAFLTTDEAGVPEVYKDAILRAHENETRLTRSFSGRPARGIVNRFMNEVDGDGGQDILAFPVQNALTRTLRAEAAKLGRSEFLSLWAGQGVRLARREPAAALVKRVARECESVLRGISRLATLDAGA